MTPTLIDLPLEVLQRIVWYLINDDPASADEAVRTLGGTCRSLRRSARHILRSGAAFPINPRITHITEDHVRVSRSGTLRRSGGHGHALVLFEFLPKTLSVIWYFQIRSLNGRRIDIGVTSSSALTSGTHVTRAKATLFDCFGRVHVLGKARTYGRQMVAGDVVGVAFDPLSRSVRFLEGTSQSMGDPLDVPDGELVPFVYFGEKKSEALTILRVKPAERIPRRLTSSHLWKRRKGLPFANCLIVSTWEETVWYALPVCWKTTTLYEVFVELAQRQSFAVEQIQLLHCQQLLLPECITLEEAGIELDERTGTHAHDIHLSVPHLVS